MLNISLYLVQGKESIFVGYNRTNKTRHHSNVRNVIETLREGVSMPYNHIAVHTQFIRDLAINRENALAREIEELACSTRRINGWLLDTILATKYLVLGRNV